MKTYSKILLLLLACLLSVNVSARKKPRQVVSADTIYVKPYEMPNAGYYLPAPPDTASMDFVDDMIQWQWGKHSVILHVDVRLIWNHPGCLTSWNR